MRYQTRPQNKNFALYGVKGRHKPAVVQTSLNKFEITEGFRSIGLKFDRVVEITDEQLVNMDYCSLWITDIEEDEFRRKALEESND